MKIKSILLVTAVGALSLTAPVIDVGEMQFDYAYQFKPAEIATAATSTATLPPFKDDDQNGLISVAVYTDSKGIRQEVQIDDDRYLEMGKIDGYSKNPTKIEYQSLLDRSIKRASAAIAYDSSATANVGAASSLTYAHTVSGSDRLLVVQAYWSDSRTLSSITYNGVAMTDVVAVLDTGGGERHGMRYLIAPTTGANNVVVTLSGSTGIASNSASYTGTDQTDPIDATRTETALETGLTYQEAITSTVDNTWALWATREYAGRTVSAGTATALRQREATVYGIIFADSNAAITPAGGRTLELTANLSGNWYSDILVTIIPSAVLAVPEDIIWFFN